MFTDYYQTLQVSFDASKEEIKISYRRLAKIWHPDLNKKPNAEEMMKKIVEAYLILNDSDARHRYDIEYQRYKQYQEKSKQFSKDAPPEENHSFYNVEDEILRKWIANAKKQAKVIASQAYDDLKGTAKNTFKYFIKSSGIALLFFFVILFILIVFGIIRRSIQ